MDLAKTRTQTKALFLLLVAGVGLLGALSLVGCVAHNTPSNAGGGQNAQVAQGNAPQASPEAAASGGAVATASPSASVAPTSGAGAAADQPGDLLNALPSEGSSNPDDLTQELDSLK